MNTTTTLTLQEPPIFTVSAFNREVKMLLEGNFPYVWIEGEISNFASPQSGHWYFSLKDHAAQVRCAMFKGSLRKLDFIAKDGMHVLIKAKASLYENRGDYQLIAESMEERGEGKLKRAFEELKKKLELEGLFDNQYKKPLPIFPKTIGIITSTTGAAIRDILNVLKRRFSLSSVIIYPTLVQGKEAHPQIVNAIEIANQRNECEVLILARGGGSLEDLWPFNEESVARAIFKSTLPIISGVGHEIDFTIADFVADKRAPTPSAAAELSVPDTQELLNAIRKQQQILGKFIKECLQKKIQEADWLEKRLQHLHPKKQLMEKYEKLQIHKSNLLRIQNQIFSRLKTVLKQAQLSLIKVSPVNQVYLSKQILQKEEEKINVIMNNKIYALNLNLAELASKMDTLSPLATLKRGYGIALDNQHRVIKSIENVKIDDTITVKLDQGSLFCLVKEKVKG